MPLGLPERKCGALGIVTRRHSPGVHHVERPRDYFSTQWLDLRGRFVDIGDGEIGSPMSGYAGRRGIHRRSVVAFGPENNVTAAGAGKLDRCPREHFTIELLRAFDIASGEFRPAEGTRRVAFDFRHPHASSTWTIIA